jgi:hypothetical protein
MADDELEQLRAAYGALGPGLPAEARRLFAPDIDADGSDWYVKVHGKTSRRLRASELASTDLFALPSSWEVMRTEVRTLTRKAGVVTVTGFMYCRPRGSWENMRVPILHMWTMCLGKAVRFQNLVDGIELCRADRRARGVA